MLRRFCTSTLQKSSRSRDSDQSKNGTMVVVVGSGITGTCVSYYLSKLSRGSVPITLIDAVENPGSSGCSRGAGAFLSESWGDGTRTEPLHRRSFQLHADLAQELDIESYRELPVFSVSLDVDSQNDNSAPHAPSWLQSLSHAPLPGRSVSHAPLPGRAAQVDPSELVKALFDYSVDNGATSCVGSVIGVTVEDGTITSIQMASGNTMPIDDDIVFTTGAWASKLEDWLEIPTPIEGVWSTSLIWNEGSINQHIADSPAALFFEEDANGCHLEILPRQNGSLYVSGCGASKVLSPATIRSDTDSPKPGETNKPDSSRVAAARTSIGKTNILLSSDCPPGAEQACIRPVSPDAAPILGRIPGVQNAFIATGGGPWGITWGPLIGQSVARLILDRDPAINLRNFSPRRFDTPVYKSLLRQRGKQAGGKPVGEQW